MKKYLREYRMYISKVINSDNDADLELIISHHLEKIKFFQHERLIHLIVTVLFSVLLFISLCLVLFINSLPIILLSILLLALIIPYIIHYYFLENQVQELYRDYDKLFVKLHGSEYLKNTHTIEQEKK